MNNPYRIPPVTGPATKREKIKARYEVHIKPLFSKAWSWFKKRDFVSCLFPFGLMILSTILIVIICFLGQKIRSERLPLQENWIITCEEDVLKEPLVAAKITTGSSLKVIDMKAQIWLLPSEACVAKSIQEEPLESI